jgi:hypothetical protein
MEWSLLLRDRRRRDRRRGERGRGGRRVEPFKIRDTEVDQLFLTPTRTNNKDRIKIIFDEIENR